MTEMKNNFRNKYENIQCNLCKKHNDEQSHLFYCEVLINNCKSLADNYEIEYEDIFSECNDKQSKAIDLISEIWKIREKLLESVNQF